MQNFWGNFSQQKKSVLQHLVIVNFIMLRYNKIHQIKYVRLRSIKEVDKMQIAICDDEKEIRELLAGKVQGICPEADISIYKTGEELITGEQPDILLLDIQMPGRNGMEVARELRKKWKDAILIFVTAMEEYVFQAFDVGAFHYIVKPFTDEKLEAVLKNAKAQYQEKQKRRQGNLREQEERYILVQKGGIHTKVFLKDIVYAEVFNRKIMIHKTDGELEYYGKLSELEKQLGEDFFRPHRAYLVHFKYVEKYNATTIYLEKGTALMAKKNYPEFVKSYLKYNQRKGKAW